MSSAFKRWFVALLVCSAVVILCVLFVDRPVAQLAHALLPDRDALKLPLNIVLLFVPLGAFALFAGGVVLLAGHDLPRWMMVTMLAGLSVMWALASNYFLLQPFFGRIAITTYLLHPAHYGFVPFHGHSGRGFPSGHTVITASFLLVFWHFYPRARALIGVVIAAVMAGLVVATWHFVSDVVGGLFVGALATAITIEFQAVLGRRAIANSSASNS